MITEAMLTNLTAQLGISLWLFVLVMIWTLVWKAIALWKAARKNSRMWFVVLLLVNSLGILEILYIFLFSKIKLPKEKEKSSKKKRRK